MTWTLQNSKNPKPMIEVRSSCLVFYSIHLLCLFFETSLGRLLILTGGPYSCINPTQRASLKKTKKKKTLQNNMNTFKTIHRQLKKIIKCHTHPSFQAQGVKRISETCISE